MAIQKRHRGTLGDFDAMDVSDLSFEEPKTAPVPEPTIQPEPEPTAAPKPVVAPEPVAAVQTPVVETPIPTPAMEVPQPVEVPQAPVVTTQPAATAQPVVVEQPVVEEKPRRGRPKGIKGAGPKRLNLIPGDTDKVLALQLPSKLIEGLKNYADDHDITMKELIGKTLMKKIGPEYYNN